MPELNGQTKQIRWRVVWSQVRGAGVILPRAGAVTGPGEHVLQRGVAAKVSW
jgi:hypothetical protein